MGVPINRLRRLPEIVGADDRRVAPGIAAAEPALVENRDVAHAVLRGQVIGGGEAMTAGADDDRVIDGFGSGERHCSGQPLWPAPAARR